MDSWKIASAQTIAMIIYMNLLFALIGYGLGQTIFYSITATLICAIIIDLMNNRQFYPECKTCGYKDVGYDLDSFGVPPHYIYPQSRPMVRYHGKVDNRDNTARLD